VVLGDNPFIVIIRSSNASNPLIERLVSL
jgi:hypothetical protein